MCIRDSYETRYRTVTDTKTDDQGRTYTETRTESYQERVNTHSANEKYHYDHHEDKSSDNLDGIKCEGVTRIHLTKGSKNKKFFEPLCINWGIGFMLSFLC